MRYAWSVLWFSLLLLRWPGPLQAQTEETVRCSRAQPCLPSRPPVATEEEAEVPPDATMQGFYLHWVQRSAGHYQLQRTGERVTLTLTGILGIDNARPPALFVMPPAYRPPFPIIREVETQPVRESRQVDRNPEDVSRIRLQIGVDGTVRTVDRGEARAAGSRAHTVHTAWGTTPAANDRTVLEILSKAWGRDLDRDYLGVVLDAAGRVQTLDWSSPVYSMYRHVTSRTYRAWQLPPELGQLGHLTHLFLGGNELSGPIPSELGQLRQLQVLGLTSSYLSGPIPPELGQLRWLKTLSLGGNRLSGPIPPELGQLHRLEWLELYHNQLTIMPPELGYLAQLEFLTLDHNRLSALPPAVGQLTHLRYLDVSGNRLTTLPSELAHLPLIHLDASGNRLTILPSELQHLPHLIYLDLEANRLSTLPAFWVSAQGIEELDVSHNHLMALPPALDRFACLTTLHLGGNPLTALPSELAQIVTLNSLSLRGQPYGIPDDVLRSMLATLAHRTPTRNLQCLPPVYTSRFHLDLGAMRLTQVFPELWQIPGLTSLDLSDNLLTELPWDRLNQLATLEKLDIRNNRLTGCVPKALRERVRVYARGNPDPFSWLSVCSD